MCSCARKMLSDRHTVTDYSSVYRKTMETEGKKKAEQENFFDFSNIFFFYHYLSIKSKELIHTISFCTIYILYIYTALKRKRGKLGKMENVFLQGIGESCPRLLMAQIFFFFFFFCLNAALGGKPATSSHFEKSNWDYKMESVNKRHF